MAILRTPLPEHICGQIGKTVVIKHRLGKTIMTAYPDMSKVVYNENQKAEQRRFADAVAYARSVVRDPEKKALYQAKLPKGKKVFNAVVAEYMSKKEGDREGSDSVHVRLSYAQKPSGPNQKRSRSVSGPSPKALKYLPLRFVVGEPLSGNDHGSQT